MDHDEYQEHVTFSLLEWALAIQDQGSSDYTGAATRVQAHDVLWLLMWARGWAGSGMAAESSITFF
jgi:hypothetical protein